MRNGNYTTPPKLSETCCCSYPTYEEWKPVFNLDNNDLISFVLILPMRNGNRKASYNVLNIVRVLILPMRNGNWYGVCNWLYSFFHVLILPMRNGNLATLYILMPVTSVLILPMRNGNSYIFLYQLFANKFLSYLWGMETRKGRPQETHKDTRSYPTYEEWKQEIHYRFQELETYVLILPMRNGNYKPQFSISDPFRVLILPMRNGNLSLWIL